MSARTCAVCGRRILADHGDERCWLHRQRAPLGRKGSPAADASGSKGGPLGAPLGPAHAPLAPKTAPKGRKRAAKRGRRDPVTDATWAAVMARDAGCVGPRVGLPRPCDGPLELDHVLSLGLGLRGPSEQGNLVVLCRRHHRYKTEHSREARPLLVAYLAVPRFR